MALQTRGRPSIAAEYAAKLQTAKTEEEVARHHAPETDLAPHILIQRMRASEERRYETARTTALDMGLGEEMAALVERAARAEAEGLDHHRNRTILNLYARGHYEAARAIQALAVDA